MLHSEELKSRKRDTNPERDAYLWARLLIRFDVLRQGVYSREGSAYSEKYGTCRIVKKCEKILYEAFDSEQDKEKLGSFCKTFSFWSSWYHKKIEKWVLCLCISLVYYTEK